MKRTHTNKLYYKTFICFFALTLFFSSCEPVNRKTNAIPTKTNLQIFLDDCLENNPNANNNSVTREVFADTIKTRLQSQIGDTLSILSNLHLEYEGNIEYPRLFEEKPNEYLVKFYLSSFGEESIKSDKFTVTLQALTIMEKEEVIKLKEREKYYIQGVFIDFANCSKETGFVLPSRRCLEDYPSVTSYYDKLDINLGTLILKDVKFISTEETNAKK